MALNVPVKESIQIPEGNHTGKIADLSERLEPYHYIDLHIELADVKTSEGSPVTIKEGFPGVISKNSKLGRLLSRFGMSKDDLEAAYGANIDIEKWIKVGSKVSLMTINTKTENGTFARVVEESIKPLR